MRGAARQEHGDDIALLDQQTRIFNSQLGIKLVVQRDQLNLVSADAPLGVDGINIELGTVGSFLDTTGCRARETRGLSDQDLGVNRRTETQAHHGCEQKS